MWIPFEQTLCFSPFSWLNKQPEGPGQWFFNPVFGSQTPLRSHESNGPPFLEKCIYTPVLHLSSTGSWSPFLPETHGLHVKLSSDVVSWGDVPTEQNKKSWIFGDLRVWCSSSNPNSKIWSPSTPSLKPQLPPLPELNLETMEKSGA